MDILDIFVGSDTGLACMVTVVYRLQEGHTLIVRILNSPGAGQLACRHLLAMFIRRRQTGDIQGSSDQFADRVGELRKASATIDELISLQ